MSQTLSHYIRLWCTRFCLLVTGKYRNACLCIVQKQQDLSTECRSSKPCWMLMLGERGSKFILIFNWFCGICSIVELVIYSLNTITLLSSKDSRMPPPLASLATGHMPPSPPGACAMRIHTNLAIFSFKVYYISAEISVIRKHCYRSCFTYPEATCLHAAATAAQNALE